MLQETPPPPSVSEPETVRYVETGTVRPRNAVGRTVRRFSKGKRRTVRPAAFPGRTAPIRPGFRGFQREVRRFPNGNVKFLK
jgi:hypothetical protein